MALTAQTRKILWARSGNQCAKCEAILIASDEMAPDGPAVIGQECHIVAAAPDGPRGLRGPRTQLDSYENLILLCANCHALVDARPDLFSRDELLRIKKQHEQLVAKRGSPVQPAKLTYLDRLAEVKFHCMANGDLLMGMLSSSLSFNHSYPSDLTSSQRALLGDFFQAASDWMDCHDVIGPRGHFDAAENLDDYIGSLRDENLVVYAAHRQMQLTGGSAAPSDWRHIHIHVAHVAHVLTSEADTAVGAA